MNNSTDNPLIVRPTLYDQNGNALPVAAIQIPGRQNVHASIADWIAASGGGRLQTTQGSLVLDYTAPNAGSLGAQAVVRNWNAGISFDVPDEMPMNFMSSKLEGMWWRPTSGPTCNLVVSNMSVWIRFALWLGLVIGLGPIGQAPSVTLAQVRLTQQKGPSTGLVPYLEMLGRKYGLYFTFEDFYGDGVAPTSRLQDRLITYPMALAVQREPSAPAGRLAEGGRAIEEMERLRKAIPEFTYALDLTNQHIIHVIDSRQAVRKDYALNAVLPSIDFEGALFALPSAIGKAGQLPISSPELLFIGQTYDRKTQVKVKAEKWGVRDLLSDFVKLDGRPSHILWIASSDNSTGRWRTSVSYP